MSQKLFVSTLITGGMTLISRLLGFTRDVVIAKFFGVSIATDAFFVAFKIPNFLRRLFAEGAFSQAFVPVLSEYKETKTNSDLKSLIDHVAGRLSLILFFVTLISIVIAPVIIVIFAPGYLDASDNRYELATNMLRITFPYLLFISLTALGGAILNTHKYFAAPAFAPVLLNISIILCTIYLSSYLDTPIYALSIGVLIGGIVQLLFVLPFLKKIHCLPRLRFSRGHKGVKKINRLIIPALFGVSVSQINLLLDTIVASFLEPKSISWLYYADRLLEFPLGIFGIALATVVLPSLSKDHAQQDSKSFREKINWSLRLVILGTFPAAIGLFLLAEPMLITLFQYGEFSQIDASMSAWALRAYSIGLLAFIAIKVLANGYFSRQDTKTPVKIGIIAMFSNMVLNLIFVGLMLHYNFIAPHMGLALATVLSAVINVLLLYRGLVKLDIYSIDKNFIIHSVKILIAGILMSISIIVFNPSIDQWHHFSLYERVIQLLILILVAKIVYFVMLKLMKVQFILKT